MADNKFMHDTDNRPTDGIYKAALEQAYDEWNVLEEKEREIAIKKAQLKQTLLALSRLVYPDTSTTDISSMSLADACRLVIGGTSRPLTAIEMRGRLTDLGFDLAKYENPMASIHTALSRMVDSEEMIYIKEEDKKKFTAGPELKALPTAERDPSTDPLRNLVAAALAKMKEEKK